MRDIAKNIAVLVLVSAAVYFSLEYPADIGRSVKDSVDRCFEVIIPSLFIFICVTSYISMSGLHSLLGTPLRFISEKVFRLPKEGFAVFLLSMVSGYPAGIKLVGDCVRDGSVTPEQSRAMSCFCCCGGPAFISGTAAAYLYPDSNAALIIFVSVVSANMLTALILTRSLPEIKAGKSEKTVVRANALVPAVRSASSAVTQMCVMIAVFGGICCMLRLSGAVELISEGVGKIMGISREAAGRIVMSFLEISNIVDMPKMNTELFPAVTFLLSFGGVCVVMQIAALAHEHFDMKMFIIARFFTAFAAAVISRLLMRFLTAGIACSETVKVFSRSKNAPVSSVLLFIMMIMTLMLCGKTSNRKK